MVCYNIIFYFKKKIPCSLTPAMKETFSWALPIPGKTTHARCKFDDATIISVENGGVQLSRHVETSEHSKAAADSRLQAFFNDVKLLIHLDQFVIHTEPIYNFTKAVQLPKLIIFTCLESIRNLLIKFLQRLGHSVLLSPSKYKSLLFKSDKPKFFCNKVKNLHYTEDFAHVLHSLNNLTASEQDEIVENWGQKNEEQLQRILISFKLFCYLPS